MLKTLLSYSTRMLLPGLLATVCSNHAVSAGLYQYAMYTTINSHKESCELKQRYSLNNKNPSSFPGKNSEHGCLVTIPKKHYESKFQFCYLSGINLHKTHNGQSAECFIQQRDDDYAFNAYIGQNPDPESQVMCYFTCIGSTEN